MKSDFWGLEVKTTFEKENFCIFWGYLCLSAELGPVNWVLFSTKIPPQAPLLQLWLWGNVLKTILSANQKAAFTTTDQSQAGDMTKNISINPSVRWDAELGCPVWLLSDHMSQYGQLHSCCDCCHGHVVTWPVRRMRDSSSQPKAASQNV